MSINLSILICTIPGRISELKKLMDVLSQQLTSEVEVIYLGDNKKRTVGQKRNDLLKLSQGRYVAFIDDDDKITEDYVSLLLKGIRSGADVVNFDVECSVNGGPFKKVFYDAKFKTDKNKPDHYERIPNHLMCIKREIALTAGFPEKSFGEDQEYAKRILPRIQRQAKIEKTLYYYIFSHKTSQTQ